MAVGQDQLEQVGLLYVSTLELIGWPAFSREIWPCLKGVSCKRLALINYVNQRGRCRGSRSEQHMELQTLVGVDAEPVILTRAVQAGLKVLGKSPLPSPAIYQRGDLKAMTYCRMRSRNLSRATHFDISQIQQKGTRFS